MFVAQNTICGQPEITSDAISGRVVVDFDIACSSSFGFRRTANFVAPAEAAAAAENWLLMLIEIIQIL